MRLYREQRWRPRLSCFGITSLYVLNGALVLSMQVNRELLPNRLAFGCHRGFKQTVLDLLRQSTPAAKQLIRKVVTVPSTGRGL